MLTFSTFIHKVAFMSGGETASTAHWIIVFLFVEDALENGGTKFSMSSLHWAVVSV